MRFEGESAALDEGQKPRIPFIRQLVQALRQQVLLQIMVSLVAIRQVVIEMCIRDSTQDELREERAVVADLLR